jgi:hypothetical protein
MECGAKRLKRGAFKDLVELGRWTLNPLTDIPLRCRQGLLVIRNRSFAVHNVANSSRRMAYTSRRAASHDTCRVAGALWAKLT